MSGTIKTRVYIVHERDNPSTDFYICPRFPSEQYSLSFYNFNQLPTVEDLSNAIVVLVRYVSPAWCRLIKKHRSQLKQLIYFMDDDLLDYKATKGLPWRYRLKMYQQITRHKKWLLKQNPNFWFSTDYLLNKYAQLQPELKLPLPYLKTSDVVRVFYHGSITHQAEIDWLYGVIDQVLQRAPNIQFELIGNEEVNRKFRSLERVQVVNLMSWKAYKYFVQQPGRHIGLVPLLDNGFNAGRSCVKFFDITRSNAVGIYAEGSECAKWIEDGVEGVVLPMQKALWVEQILKLASNEALRSQFVKQALELLDNLNVADA